MHASGPAESRALRTLLHVGGAIATAAGLDTVLRGARSVAGQGPANAALESELRFYGAFYAAYGVVVLRAASRVDQDPAELRGVAGALMLAGLARAGGWLAAGRPHPLQRALLAVELIAPPAVVVWQARAARVT